MQIHFHEYRPVTSPEFISDALNMCHSKEVGDVEIYHKSREKLIYYFNLFSPDSWMIRSIILLLENYGETIRYNPEVKG